MKMKILILGGYSALVGAAFTLGQTTPPASGVEDGITVVNDRAYVLRNGQATPLSGNLTWTISPDGVVTGLDGQKRKLSDRTLLTMDGRIIPAPPGVVFPAAPTAPADFGREAVQGPARSGTRGENLSGLAPENPNRPNNGGASADDRGQPGAAAAMPSSERATNNPNATPTADGGNNDRHAENRGAPMAPDYPLPYGAVVAPGAGVNQAAPNPPSQNFQNQNPVNPQAADGGVDAARENGGTSTQNPRSASTPLPNQNQGGAGTSAADTNNPNATRTGGTNTNASQPSAAGSNAASGSAQGGSGASSPQQDGTSTSGVGSSGSGSTTGGGAAPQR